MNLVEKLMAVDKKEFDKIEKKELYSKELSKLIGEETKITIQAIDSELLSSLTTSMLNGKGKVDYTKAYDVASKIVVAGLVNPDLKDDVLLKHMGVATPAEAVKKIFKGEVTTIGDEISALGGFIDYKESEKEIKN